MSEETQARRRWQLTTPLGPDALLPIALHGTEAISCLFAYDLDVATPIGRELAFEDILGQPAGASIRQGEAGTRHVHGIVASVTALSRDLYHNHYRLQVVPRVWLLGRNRRSRIFQHRTTPQLLQEVLRGYDVETALQDSYAVRPCCVQYEESDWAFACRLMEDDGIRFHFAHSEGGHRLVLSDSSILHPRLPDDRPACFGHAEGHATSDWQIATWQPTQRIGAAAAVLRDRWFQAPQDPLEARASGLVQARVGRAERRLQFAPTAALELVEYPGGYAKRHDALVADNAAPAPPQGSLLRDRERTVRLRMEAEECLLIRITGRGNAAPFTAGYAFDLRDAGEHDGSYLLTRVEHEARNAGWEAGKGGADHYAGAFECQPTSLRFRPQRVTPRPFIAGVQTATVTGRHGEELHCDRYGRIKVRFHWDRDGPQDDRSSCWLRVAQAWAGAGWGSFFWPRVGHEVVVAFENGDPDCPLVVGSVYNARNLPPYALPDNKLLGGIRSASVRGVARQNFNGLVFNDTHGGEHLAIHSERNLTLNAEYDKSVTAGRHKGERVSNSSLFAVGTLPGGGSGGGPPGGGDGTGMQAGNSIDVPQPINQAPGLNAIWVFGENMQAALGLNHQVAFGNNQQICINPAGLVAGMGGGVSEPLLTGLLGGGAGNVQMTLGANVQLTMGQSFQINLGPKGINVDGAGDYTSHALSFILGCSLGLAAGLYALGYGLAASSSDYVTCGTFTAIYQLLVDALLETIMIYETAVLRYGSTMHTEWNSTFIFNHNQLGKAGEALGKDDLLSDTVMAALLALITATLLATTLNQREKDEHDGS